MTVTKGMRLHAQAVVAAINDENDRSYGVATQWCEHEAERLIAEALADAYHSGRRAGIEHAAAILESAAAANSGPTRQGENNTAGMMRRIRAGWQMEDAEGIREHAGNP